MRKYIKPDSKSKKEKLDNKKTHKDDKDIHLNVIGVPVTNVIVDKKLERQPTSDFHMYRISIDTSRSSRETKDKRSSVRVSPTPRAVSTPPRLVRVPIIPSDTSSSGSDGNNRAGRSISATAMKSPVPQSGKGVAAHGSRDKFPGSKKTKPILLTKKKAEPEVCYTEEKRPVRIVGRLKTPEDEKDRQRKFPKRRNSKQVEFSDRDSVYGAHEEAHARADLASTTIKGAAPQVYRAQDISSSPYSGPGSKNVPHPHAPDNNKEDLYMPSTSAQASKAPDKGDVAYKKESESTRRARPESMNFDSETRNNSPYKPREYNNRNVSVGQSIMNAPQHDSSKYASESVGLSRETPIQPPHMKPGMKPVQISIASRNELLKSNASPELNQHDDPMKNYSSYKPVAQGYRRNINTPASAKSGAKETISPTHSNESRELSNDRPYTKPVESRLANNKEVLPTKTQNGPTTEINANEYQFPRTNDDAPSSNNGMPGFIPQKHSNETTRFPKLETQLNYKRSIPHETHDKLTSASFLPDEGENGYKRFKANVPYREFITPDNVYSERAPLKTPQYEYSGTELRPRNKTKRETSNKLTSVSHIMEEGNNEYAQFKGNAIQKEFILPDNVYSERAPLRNVAHESSDVLNKKNETKYTVTDSENRKVIGKEYPVVEINQFSLQNQHSFMEYVTDTQDLGNYDTDMSPSTMRKSSSKPTSTPQPTKADEVDLQYEAAPQTMQYQPTAERTSVTETGSRPHSRQSKRISVPSFFKRSSKESTGSKSEQVYKSPNRSKYITSPLVSSIPKPNLKNTKYADIEDNRGGNEQVDGSSVEISHRTYGDISSVDTSGGIDEKAAMGPKRINPEYPSMEPDQGQSKRPVSNALVAQDMVEEPVFTSSYIPNRNVGRSLKNNGSFENRFNAPHNGSLERNTIGKSGSYTENMYPIHDSSRRLLNEEEITDPLEYIDMSNFPGTDVNDGTSWPKKPYVDDKQFENRLISNQAEAQPSNVSMNPSQSKYIRNSSIERGQERGPSNEYIKEQPIDGQEQPLNQWSKPLVSNPDVMAYVGHVDPNNPFDHKPTYDGELPVDYAVDEAPDYISKYIENERSAPPESVIIPVDILKGLSIPEDDTLLHTPSDVNEFIPITTVPSNRALKNVPSFHQIENNAPIGRFGRPSKSSMPTVETILEEDVDIGGNHEYDKIYTSSPALGKGEKNYERETPVDKNDLEGVLTRQPTSAPSGVDGIDKDSAIYGYSDNDKPSTSPDMLVYLGDVDNTNPFGHNGGLDRISEKDSAVRHDKTSISPSAGSRRGEDLVQTEQKDRTFGSPSTQHAEIPKSSQEKYTGKKRKPSAETPSASNSLQDEGTSKPGKAKKKSRDRSDVKSKKTASLEKSTRWSGTPEAVFLGKIPNTAMNVFYSPNDENEILPTEARQLGDGPIQQTDSGRLVTEGPKGILIFVNKKDDGSKSPFEDPHKLSKKSTNQSPKQSKDKRSSSPNTVIEKEGSKSIVKKEYPCGCIRTTRLDKNNELTGEELISVNCKDGSQCKVRLPKLQKRDRVLSTDESRSGSSGRVKQSRKPSSEFPEIEIVADGIVSKKPIEPKPPKPTMKGANLTGTINLKSNKLNAVCHLYLEPKLKDYLRNNMHVLQEILERDERKSSRRSS